MAFLELFPTKPSANEERVPLRIGMTQRKGARARLVLLFDRSILSQLGGSGERYRIQLGSVENRHELRLIQDDQGLFKAATAGGKQSMTVRITLPIVDQFPDCKIAAESTKFAVSKNELTVTLPAWAWNPEAKRVREKSGRS